MRGSGAVLLGLTLLFHGCGSGGGSSTPDDPVVPPDPTTTVANSVALGPIGGATVTVTDLAGQQQYLTVTTPFNAATDLMDDNVTLVPYTEQTVGKFTVSLPGLASTQLVLVKAAGGEDIDPNDDGQYDAAAVKTVQGSLYAYVTVADLLNNNVRVNAFTTIAAEWIRREGLTDETEIKSVLARLSGFLFASPSTALSAFNPAKLTTGGAMEDVALLNDSQSYGDAVASTTIQELFAGTTHLFHDADNDALFDDFELLVGTNPAAANSDGDALGDYGEFFAGTDPMSSDTGVYEDPLTQYQWHLDATEPNDINVASVWESYAGRRNIYVGVVDTGIEAVHPDLASNLDLTKSYRWSDGSNDPSPDADQLATDPYLSAHGTACAGLVAASGWNSVGVKGVAPFVKLAGYNVFSQSPLTDVTLIQALSKEMDISSNSWGDPSEILYGDQTLIDGLQTGAEQGRSGKGIVYVMAAGNDRSNSDYSPLHIGNANNAGVANNPYVITVTATDKDGSYSSYANFGANVLLAAPGGEFGEQYDAVNGAAIVTTDYTGYDYGFESTGFVETYRLDPKTNLPVYFDVPGNENGDYTNYMNGSSAAVPMVSGVAALMLSANPDLTYRDIRYILATTARKNDPGDGDWTTNGAGWHINHNYGFGLLDAAAAVAKAEGFASLGAETVLPKLTNDIADTTVPDANATGVTSTITETQALSVEHVDVWVTIDHARPGDLDIRLTSPEGTESHLAYGGAYYLEGSYANWRFSTVRALDEGAAGTWTLTVKDLRAGTEGTFKSWSLQVRGH
ncbi:S8 family peptidase [Sulfurimonas diazotrophicus]|uniref:S8 family peptidase n=1 Tax=Sulfurimonas diazotrophicus TaxID=3131939 RepID=A0ABZ3H9M0_9BACT